MRRLLIVISGPSGAGKGTIKDELKKDGGIIESVSCTTRQPRDNEKDGERYYFITEEEFDKKIRNGEFLEYSGQFKHRYGTPKKFVVDNMKDNDIILEIDVNGGLNVKKAFPQAVLIMILPPDKEELKNRLILRKTESKEEIEERLKRYDYEVGKKDLYDYVIVNDKLDVAVKEIKEIINKERNKD